MNDVSRSPRTIRSTSTTSGRATRSARWCAAASAAASRSTRSASIRRSSTSSRPLFDAVLRVEIEGGEHVPATGPAALVANRGFGIFEPSVLGIAVRRTVVAPPAHRRRARGSRDRRARAPPRRDQLQRARHARVPARGQPRRGPARAHVAAHRRGHPAPSAAAGDDQRADRARSRCTPGGPFGTALGPWRVRFGPLVTLPDPYDPGDPLAAARFGEAVRDAVSALLEQSKK